MIKKAVFPAAGYGTRFLPATKSIPKEMLPLVDKPLIQYTVEEAAAAGIEEIIIITGMGKHAIEDHFDSSFELEYNLKSKGKEDLLKEVEQVSDLVKFAYTRQKVPRGLGHAISCIENLVASDEPFAVILGDDIIDAEVPAMKQMADVNARFPGTLLAVQRVPMDQTHLYGIVEGTEIEKGIYEVSGMVEKPKINAPSNLAIIGRYILTPAIFPAIESTGLGSGGEIQLTDAIHNLIGKEKVYAYEFSGDRYDAGDKLGFLKANVAMALKRDDLGDDFRGFLKELKL